MVSFSDDYPLLNALQPSLKGTANLVLSQFTPAGALAFSTYLDATDDGAFEAGVTLFARQSPGGMVINSSGKIIIASAADEDDFPVIGSGTSRAGSTDMILSIIDRSGDTDSDGDGVPDAVDAFPADINEWRDTDGDGTGDNADPDDDGDGEPDVSDVFPRDSSETVDADADGAGDNLDEFDADALNYFDLDNDGTADFADTDADGDGTDSSLDFFDYDAGETQDTDGDGIGDNTDADIDGDGFLNANDADPLDDQVPVITFENYNALFTNQFLSPCRMGFRMAPALTWPGPVPRTRVSAATPVSTTTLNWITGRPPRLRIQTP